MTELILAVQQLMLSGTHIIGKGLTYDVDPRLALLFRALISAMLFLVYILVRFRGFRKIEMKDMPALVILGALNIPINQFLFLTSIKLTNPPNVALAYAMTPAFVFVISAIFLKERTSWLRFSGIVLAIAGAILVLSEDGFDFSSEFFLGDVLALTASISWALYTVIGRNFSRKYGASYSTGMAMIVGFLLYVPIFFLMPVKLETGSISGINWLQLSYLGIVTSGIAYALWYYALTKTDASKVAVFNNLQPIYTTILSIFIFGQVLTSFFIIGGILVITGVILTQRG